MPVKPLFELATLACMKNLRELGSIGDYLPYEAVRHLLLKIDSASQLREIELNSPQIKGRTGEIWLKLIENDFPLEYKTKAYKPQNPDKWYRVWEKYKRNHDSAIEESENKLKSALAGLKQDKEKNTSRIIERKLLPKSAKLGGGKKLFSGQREAHSNHLSFNSGSRTKTVNGASVMRKVRREVKEIATIHGSLSKSIRTPANVSQIRKAPASMVNDYRRAAQPEYRSSALSPEPPCAVAEHEERATYISDSDEEDNDELFDDATKISSRPAKKIVAQFAATSLSKRRSHVQQVAASSPSTIKRVSASNSNTASSPAKKNTSSLANKFNRPPVKSPPVSPQQSSSGATKALDTNFPHRINTSPPPSAGSGPSSPPHLESPVTAPRVISRKRKCVDVFMRPKKR
ncbi:RNA polymerase II transcription factor SIII, subunit A [Metarhizium rileyi]|uniref:RNA polymerase II transcription factor SIII, subunit A n=1 Tax=Metarhizium rileyi (strain RCEF 4871) TaxID=1649241 RepID=A0A167IQW1_METRR|nr:RNA polymerase II transcription factor SIII, subunit A [Metarhizium rileyi RCEF 4871]